MQTIAVGDNMLEGIANKKPQQILHCSMKKGASQEELNREKFLITNHNKFHPTASAKWVNVSISDLYSDNSEDIELVLPKSIDAIIEELC